MKKTVALFGAAGKIGARITNRLKGVDAWARKYEIFTLLNIGR